MLFNENYEIKTYKTQSPTLSLSHVVYIILYPNTEDRTEISVKKNCLIQCDYNIVYALILYYYYCYNYYTLLALTLFCCITV